ncbi:hypothetical protein EJ07DRAFT_177196 [Lizonia empirigonia]|nr:hypothetical protein EJ07DRAFT_177196 [Lizonia empirigonia]
MEDNVALKSEPAAPQDAHQTPKRSEHKRMNSDDTERPATAQRDRDSAEEQSKIETEQNPSDDDADPAEQIAIFDWEALHQQYHAAINECSQGEAELMREWASLMQFFHVWAESGHYHETNRTFQRLQTRTMFVTHEEEKLENTRNHYVNVVRAFESALNLLRATGLRG